MNKKLTLTLTGIIALAITGSIGLSSSVYAQNNSSNTEIIQETEPNTNNNNRNQNPPNSDGNERIIIVPSSPSRDRSYPSNDDARFFDYSRSQRGRSYYESLIEPYHQRYELNRQNSNRLYNYRQYNRPSYSPYNRPYYQR